MGDCAFKTLTTDVRRIRTEGHRKWLRTNGLVVDRSTFVSGGRGFDSWLDGRILTAVSTAL